MVLTLHSLIVDLIRMILTHHRLLTNKLPVGPGIPRQTDDRNVRVIKPIHTQETNTPNQIAFRLDRPTLTDMVRTGGILKTASSCEMKMMEWPFGVLTSQR